MPGTAWPSPPAPTATGCLRSFIGTEVLGLSALGNQKGGVLLTGHARANVIGIRSMRPANLVSGNTGIGVLLRAGTTRNLIINNYIGLNRRARRLPNTGRPVVNHGSGNIILGNRT